MIGSRVETTGLEGIEQGRFHVSALGLYVIPAT